MARSARLLRLSENLKHRVDGIERADSLAFDLHKWGYLPFECACVLVRNPELHRDAFAAKASYLDETVTRRHCRRSAVRRTGDRPYARLQGAQGMDVVQGAWRRDDRRV